MGYKTGDDVILTPEQIEAQRGENLRKHQAKMEAVSAEIKNKEEVLARLDERYLDLGQKVKMLQSEEANLRDRIKNMAGEIETCVKNERDALAKAQKDLRVILEQGELDNARIKDDLDWRNGLINTRKDEVQAREAEVDAREKTVAEREGVIDAIERNCQDREESAAAKQAQLDQTLLDTEELRRDLETEIAALKAEKESVRAKTNGLVAELSVLDQKEKAADTAREEYEAKKAECDELIKLTQAGRQQLDQLAEDLNNKETSLKRIEQELKQRERLINAAKENQ